MKIEDIRIKMKIKIPTQKSTGDDYRFFKEDLDEIKLKGFNADYLIVDSILDNFVRLYPDDTAHYISSNAFSPEDLEPYEDKYSFDISLIEASRATLSLFSGDKLFISLVEKYGLSLNNQKVYNYLSSKSGLKVGNSVRVTREAKGFEYGWNGPWTAKMSSKINEICIIDEVNDSIRIGNYWYPFFVLEKVEPKKLPIDINFSDNLRVIINADDIITIANGSCTRLDTTQFREVIKNFNSFHN